MEILLDRVIKKKDESHKHTALGIKQDYNAKIRRDLKSRLLHNFMHLGSFLRKYNLLNLYLKRNRKPGKTDNHRRTWNNGKESTLQQTSDPDSFTCMWGCLSNPFYRNGESPFYTNYSREWEKN